LVLDEADRMLDLGFEQDVRDIIGYCAGPSQRQTAMFSATWPKSIRDLAAEFLRNPVKVGCGGRNSLRTLKRALGSRWRLPPSFIACRPRFFFEEDLAAVVFVPAV